MFTRLFLYIWFFPRHGYCRNTSLTQQFQNWRELYKYRAHNSLEGIKSKTFTRVEHTYIGVIYCVFTIYMLCSLMHVSYKTEVYFAEHKFTNIVLLVCVSSQNFYIIALKRWIGKVSLLPKYNFVRNRYMIRLFLFTRAAQYLILPTIFRNISKKNNNVCDCDHTR